MPKAQLSELVSIIVQLFFENSSENSVRTLHIQKVWYSIHLKKNNRNCENLKDSLILVEVSFVFQHKEIRHAQGRRLHFGVVSRQLSVASLSLRRRAVRTPLFLILNFWLEGRYMLPQLITQNVGLSSGFGSWGRGDRAQKQDRW